MMPSDIDDGFDKTAGAIGSFEFTIVCKVHSCVVVSADASPSFDTDQGMNYTFLKNDEGAWELDNANLYCTGTPVLGHGDPFHPITHEFLTCITTRHANGEVLSRTLIVK
jgi:hypothetical protein